MLNPDQVADQLIALINASPRSPRKEEIVEVIQAVQSQAPTGLTPVQVHGCTLGATIMVNGPSNLAFSGWMTTSPVGQTASERDIALAILDFLRNAILAGRILN